jgi:hypothetical protein
VSKSRISRAKLQVAATKVRFQNSRFTLPLAFCSSVFFSNQGRDASCTVIDPPMDPGDDDVKIDSAAAWRAAYAKALRFVGLDAASRQVFNGEPVTNLQGTYDNYDRRPSDREKGSQRFERAIAARERFGADLILDVGPCAIGIDTRVLNLLRENGVQGEMDSQLGDLADGRLEKHDGSSSSFLNYLGLGCIFYEDLHLGSDV